jgi:uncharacterized OB-fold protein
MDDHVRPTPAVDADSAPYWQAALAGEFKLPRCLSCSRVVFYPRSICPHCMSQDLVWEELSGLATALVDLDEQVRMMTRIVDCPVEVVAIGMRVRVVFRPLSDDAALPCFTPID